MAKLDWLNPDKNRLKWIMGQFRLGFVESQSQSDVNSVGNALRDAGKKGDTAAAKAYLDYTFGKAMEAVDITVTEGDQDGMLKFVNTVLKVFGDTPENRTRLAEEFQRSASEPN
jgi:hypothetical protein